MKMKKYLNLVNSCLLLTIVLLGCKKEGPIGPQGPQGPPGNPGELVGGGEEGEVRAYVFAKPLKWKYYDAGGSCWLIDNSYTGDAENYEFSMNEDDHPDDQDVVLTYLELSGNNAFWAQLPYTTQMGSSVPTETYRVIERGDFSENYTFKIRADIRGTKTPYYQVKSLRVIIIPSSNVESIGGRYAVTASNMSLAEAMKKFNLKESDFKVIQ
jgi:hypothetical protein